MNPETKAKFDDLAARIEAAGGFPPPPMCRIGKFRISAEYAKSHWRDGLPLMARVFVVRCQMIWLDILEYTALSDDFDEVPESDDPPEYRALMEMRDGKREFLKFERVTT